MPPQTRRVLAALSTWVGEQATLQSIDRGGVRFSRRTVRAHLGLSDTQLRVHLDRLVQLEYVRMHSGQNGSLYTYSMVFDGQSESDAPQVCGLREVEDEVTLRGKRATLRGQTPDLAGTLRPPCGDLAATLRGGETTRNASNGVGSGDLKAAMPEKARSRRLNGHAHGEH